MTPVKQITVTHSYFRFSDMKNYFENEPLDCDDLQVFIDNQDPWIYTCKFEGNMYVKIEMDGGVKIGSFVGFADSLDGKVMKETKGIPDFVVIETT